MDIIKKILTAAKKQPQPPKLPKDKNYIKVDKINPTKVPKGAEQALADRNQASGFTTPLEHREKTKQELKNKLRKDEWD